MSERPPEKGLSKKRKSLAVVGVGNILLGDEGVGIEVMRALEQRVGRAGAGEVDFIDAGTGFFTMVSDLAAYEMIVIIDAARGGGEPGAMYRFGMDDLKEIAAFRSAPISLHDFGVPESIAWERARGKLRGKVVFFGIEPWRVEPCLGLSEVLEAKMGSFVEKVLDELATHGVHKRSQTV